MLVDPRSADPTLCATYFLDWDTPSVARFAEEAVAGAEGDTEKAIRLFLAVRDGVRYDPYSISFDPATYRASHCLERGAAFCIPKAILLAAALRAVGVPSRLGFADVTNHLATRRLLEALRTTLFAYHGFTEIFLDGRWLKVTPAFNASLCAKFGAAPIEFDGKSDAVLQPYDNAGQRFMEYLRDRGHYDDFPFDEMKRVFLEVYPHIGEAGVLAAAERRDFDAEASAERTRG